jgi:hypothetical protein
VTAPGSRSRLAGLAAAGLAALLAAASVAAAPPPPAPVPEKAREPIDGYDVPTLFQIWMRWVEERKGAAADALLAEVGPRAGDADWESLEPVMRIEQHSYDFGHSESTELRPYCRLDAERDIRRGTCRYILTRAFVPLDVRGTQGDNPLSNWARDAFDPARLVADLRARGFGPATDWWRADHGALFEVLPSPLPALMRHAQLSRIDSRDCPALARAARSIDAQRLDWRVDLHAVGVDGRRMERNPHSAWCVFEFAFAAPGGGTAILKTSGSAAERIAAPVLDAEEACQKAARPVPNPHAR